MKKKLFISIRILLVALISTQTSIKASPGGNQQVQGSDQEEGDLSEGERRNAETQESGRALHRVSALGGNAGRNAGEIQEAGPARGAGQAPHNRARDENRPQKIVPRTGANSRKEVDVKYKRPRHLDCTSRSEALRLARIHKPTPQVVNVPKAIKVSDENLVSMKLGSGTVSKLSHLPQTVRNLEVISLELKKDEVEALIRCFKKSRGLEKVTIARFVDLPLDSEETSKWMSRLSSSLRYLKRVKHLTLDFSFSLTPNMLQLFNSLPSRLETLCLKSFPPKDEKTGKWILPALVNYLKRSPNLKEISLYHPHYYNPPEKFQYLGLLSKNIFFFQNIPQENLNLSCLAGKLSRSSLFEYDINGELSIIEHSYNSYFCDYFGEREASGRRIFKNCLNQIPHLKSLIFDHNHLSGNKFAFYSDVPETLRDEIKARGEWIKAMDIHSGYDKDYRGYIKDVPDLELLFLDLQLIKRGAESRILLPPEGTPSRYEAKDGAPPCDDETEIWDSFPKGTMWAVDPSGAAFPSPLPPKVLDLISLKGNALTGWSARGHKEGINRVFEENASPKVFDLSENYFGFLMGDIARAVGQNTSTQKLRLNCNMIREFPWACLNGSSLTHLELKDNRISLDKEAVERLHAIADDLSSRGEKKYVSLKGNPCALQEEVRATQESLSRKGLILSFE